MADISTSLENLATDLRDFRTKLTDNGISVSSDAGFRECVDALEFNGSDESFQEVPFKMNKLTYSDSIKSASGNTYGYLNISPSNIPSEYSNYSYYYEASEWISSSSTIYWDVPIDFSADFQDNILYCCKFMDDSGIELYRKTIEPSIQGDIITEETFCTYSDHVQYFSFERNSSGYRVMNLWKYNYDSTAKEYVWDCIKVNPAALSTNSSGTATCIYYGHINAHVIKLAAGAEQLHYALHYAPQYEMSGRISSEGEPEFTYPNIQTLDSTHILKTSDSYSYYAANWAPNTAGSFDGNYFPDIYCIPVTGSALYQAGIIT